MSFTLNDTIDEFDGMYAFLSNFYPSPITYPEDDPKALTYPTVEHAYQAAKTLDTSEREWVRDAETPGIAKRRGQDVTLRAAWSSLRVPTMLILVEQKFRDARLADMLVGTGEAHLIEGNVWHDYFWGDCRCNQHRGQGGLNHLGRILMDVRQILRANRGY